MYAARASCSKSRREELKKHHWQWFDKKQGLRIRMPPPRAAKPGGHWEHQRFDFSRDGVVRSAKVKFPVNTVERVRDWGVKYVFAQREADLAMCREALVRRGCVSCARARRIGGRVLTCVRS